MNLTFKQYVQLILIAVGAVSVAYYALSPYHGCMRWQERNALASFFFSGPEETGDWDAAGDTVRCIPGN